MIVKAFSLLFLLQIMSSHGLYIQVSNGGQWGTWGITERCPTGTVAKGFSVKVESYEPSVDNTGLNAIRLHCAQPSSALTVKKVTSSMGPWGSWGVSYWCPYGFLKRFKLRVEKSQGNSDNKAATGITFLCTSDYPLEAHGLRSGSYGYYSGTCHSGICGIRTRVEGPQGSGDDTALNDVHPDNEVMNRSPDNDVINWSSDNEVMNRSPDNNVINWSSDNEVMNRSPDNDVINWSSDNEVMNRSPDNDVINWSSDNDTPLLVYRIGLRAEYFPQKDLQVRKRQIPTLSLSQMEAHKVQEKQGRGDDTALNGICLHCLPDGDTVNEHTVTSSEGEFGNWSSTFWCLTGQLTSFSLNVEPPKKPGDNTAANNIKFKCTDNRVLEGAGLSRGEYGNWSKSCTDGICGIVTKVEGKKPKGDNTALNDVKFLCCIHPVTD
ncbi:uncharacterized protein WCC33_005081 [Rhinophrynus dorsalis]